MTSCASGPRATWEPQVVSRRRKGMRRFVFVLAVLGLLVAACGDDSETSTGAVGDELAGRTFLSTESTRPLVDGTRIRLELGEDGSLRANAGCNHLLGDVTSTDDGVLVVGLMGGTEMGCDPALHAQDEWLMSFLTSSPAWSLDGDTLTLDGETDRLVLVDREVADPDRPLEGTTWKVDGIIDGYTVSTVPGAPAVGATLVLSDGRVEADADCNAISASVEVRDRELRITDAMKTEMFCGAERAALEDAIFAVLSAERVEYEIEAGRLTLTTDDGRGLMLVAGE